MQEEISPARIANAICQDTTFQGSYLLVEGRRDHALYSKFTDASQVRVRATSGKYRLREVYSLLVKRGFGNALGIRDADFLRISGNPKFQVSFSEPIFVTDCHDSEIMIAFSAGINDFMNLTCDQNRIQEFEKKHGAVMDLVMELIYPLGCLRLANKRRNLGLSFKPEKPEGNALKVRKFVRESDWQVDIEGMVNTVWEYSQNRGQAVAGKHDMANGLAEVMAEKHPAHEMSNGHDFAAILHLVTTKGLRSASKLLQDASCVEDLLIAQFDLKTFSTTALYGATQSWSANAGRHAIFK